MKNGFILLVLVATLLASAVPGYAMLGPEPMPEGEGGVRILSAPSDDMPLNGAVDTQEETASQAPQDHIQEKSPVYSLQLSVISLLLLAVVVGRRILRSLRTA